MTSNDYYLQPADMDHEYAVHHFRSIYRNIRKVEGALSPKYEFAPGKCPNFVPVANYPNQCSQCGMGTGSHPPQPKVKIEVRRPNSVVAAIIPKVQLLLASAPDDDYMKFPQDLEAIMPHPNHIGIAARALKAADEVQARLDLSSEDKVALAGSLGTLIAIERQQVIEVLELEQEGLRKRAAELYAAEDYHTGAAYDALAMRLNVLVRTIQKL